MKKTRYLMLIPLICILLLASFFAYRHFHPYKLSELTNFRSDEIPVSVSVQYMDTYDGTVVMTNKDKIIKLIELLTERSYRFTTEPPMPGNNRYITLLYGDGTEVSFGAGMIKEKNGGYSPDARDGVDSLLGNWAAASGTVSRR